MTWLLDSKTLASCHVSCDSQVEAHFHFPPLRSSKVTFYPQPYAGGDGNDRYEWQRPFTKRQIALSACYMQGRK